MRLLLAVLVSAVLGVGAVACGSASKNGQSSANASATETATTISPAAARAAAVVAAAESKRGTALHYLNDDDNDQVGDADSDNNHDNDHDASLDYKKIESGDYHDFDDSGVFSGSLGYSVPASASVEQTVMAIVNRYYVAVLAEDGASACAQLVPGLAKAAALDYGDFGAAYSHRAKTCPEVTTLIFRHYHKLLRGGEHVTGVRVESARAFAMLGSTTMPASYIRLDREGSGWRVDQLIGPILH